MKQHLCKPFNNRTINQQQRRSRRIIKPGNCSTNYLQSCIRSFKLMLIMLLTLTTATSLAAPMLLRTSSGVRIYFYRSNNPKIVDINVLWQAGSAYDGKHPGLAKLTHDLMYAGANGLSATKFINNIASSGAKISGSVNRSYSLWHLRSLIDMHQLRPAMNNFKVMLSKPNFNKPEIKNHISIQQSAIEEANKSPETIATKTLLATMYKNTALAHSVLGTSKSLSKIKRSNIVRFYKKYYTKNNMKIIIVGAISRHEAIKLGAACAHNLSAGTAAKKISSIAPLNKQIAKVVNYPSQQAHIILAQTGVQATNPDYFSLLVSNQGFGGGMSSTLFQQLRVKRGLAYSAHSSWLPTPYGGLFILNLQTKAKSAPLAITLVQQLLRDYKKANPEKEIIQRSKKQIIGTLLLQQSSNRGLLKQITNIAAYNYPVDYYDTFPQKINQVNSKTIRSALKKHLHPKKMLIVAVKPERIKIGL